MSGVVFYGQTVRQSEGSRTAKDIADGWKFLLLFRTAHVVIHIFSVYYIIRVEDSNALQKNLGTDLTKFYELVNFNST